MAHDDVSNLKNEWDEIRKIHILDKMKELGLEQARLENTGDLTIRTDAVCSVSKQNMASLCRWLENNNHGELVFKTVDKNKLRNFIASQIMLGKEVPEMVNYVPYEYATLNVV